jgi:hypothetical protein
LKLGDFSLSQVIARSVSFTLIYVAFSAFPHVGKDVLTLTFLNEMLLVFVPSMEDFTGLTAPEQMSPLNGHWTLES